MDLQTGDTQFVSRGGWMCAGVLIVLVGRGRMQPCSNECVGCMVCFLCAAAAVWAGIDVAVLADLLFGFRVLLLLYPSADTTPGKETSSWLSSSSNNLALDRIVMWRIFLLRHNCCATFTTQI